MGYKALFIGAHNDECEYGTGGTANLLSDCGVEVTFLNVAASWHFNATDADKKEIVRQDMLASEILGAKKIIVDNRDNETYLCSEENVKTISHYILDIDPDMIFIHYPEDNHIEHREVARASYLAVTLSAPHGASNIKEVYAFEAGSNQTVQYFQSDLAINISPVMDTVERSLITFDQRHANGLSLWKEKQTVAKLRGMVHGFPFAEVFSIVKFPDGNNDFILRRLLNDNFRWSGNKQYPAHGRMYF